MLFKTGALTSEYRDIFKKSFLDETLPVATSENG